MVKQKIQDIQDRLLTWAQSLRHIHFGDPDKNVYDVGELFLRQLYKDDIAERAGSMAFSFTVALFPLLLFLLNLIPYLQDLIPYVTTENILLFVQEILPGNIYIELESTIMDIVSKPRQSLLSIGFFFALFASTQGVMSMMGSFNSVYKTKESRGFIRSRLIAVSIVFSLAMAVVLASSIMILGSILISRIEEMQLFNSEFLIFLFNFLKFLVLLMVFYFTTAFIFRHAPAVHDKWHFFSVGANLAGLLITSAFYGFTFYLNNFASYNKLYGSIGTLIGLMLWLYITSLIILIAFEVNVTLDLIEERNSQEDEKHPADVAVD
ncbi:MAG: YihY/virulence factor BrkB family protein [Bacteroidota bacterium]|uniref:Membrane protein n=1 Tax=Algoriphagus faecimaris TaxID=686796 RepID=A0A1G6MJG8_9BACT|nr:YihY/virulence factor BrkB family protein [Algoriphagus faecimaris]SDC55377.1 membrane protein [Algoriphagus faecimaris]